MKLCYFPFPESAICDWAAVIKHQSFALRLKASVDKPELVWAQFDYLTSKLLVAQSTFALFRGLDVLHKLKVALLISPKSCSARNSRQLLSPDLATITRNQLREWIWERRPRICQTIQLNLIKPIKRFTRMKRKLLNWQEFGQFPSSEFKRSLRAEVNWIIA